MEPKNWGKFGWGFVHNVALGYPNNEISYMEKDQYRIFFEVIGYVLPCNDCRKHYKEMVKDNPPVLVDRNSIFKWTVDIHNIVNKRLNKKIITLTEAYDIWTKEPVVKKETNLDNPNKRLYYLTFIFFLILLVAVLIILYFI